MIGSRIRELRNYLDLTLVDFGRRIGVEHSSVSGWESGRRNPSSSAIKLIVHEFNVREEWLLSGEGPVFDNPYTNFGEAVGRLLALPEDDLRRQVIQEIIDLPPDCWPLINQFVHILKKAEDK